MERKNYFLILGITFIILSIISFNFWTEDITPTCINSVKCGMATSYFEAYTKLGGFMCLDYCQSNIDNLSFNVPNQIFIELIKIGLFFIILWFSIKLIFLIKKIVRQKNKFKRVI